MTDNPSVSHAAFDEMHHLVTAILGENISSGQGQRLEELIRQDIGVCDPLSKGSF